MSSPLRSLSTAAAVVVLVLALCAMPSAVLGGSIVCDSGTSCSQGSTCCRAKGGGWMCCPYESAICCGDGLNCCPPEYPVCDLQQGQCLRDKLSSSMQRASVKMTAKVPAQRVSAAAEVEDRAEGIAAALREIVVEVGEAVREAVSAAVRSPFNVQCDPTSSCADGDTCCPTATGSWGCCPAADATCCSDMVHCCPSDYPVCNVNAGTCSSATTEDATSVPWLEKKPAVVSDADVAEDEDEDEDEDDEAEAVLNVQCDPTYSCPDGSTCCPNGSGSFNCCSFSNAVCCSDHEHCCPSDYPVCDISGGLCLASHKKGAAVSFLHRFGVRMPARVPATPLH